MWMGASRGHRRHGVLAVLAAALAGWAADTTVAQGGAAACPSGSVTVDLGLFGYGVACLCMEEAALVCADTRNLRHCSLLGRAYGDEDDDARPPCSTCAYIELNDAIIQVWKSVAVGQYKYAADDPRLRLSEGDVRTGFFAGTCETCTCSAG